MQTADSNNGSSKPRCGRKEASSLLPFVPCSHYQLRVFTLSLPLVREIAKDESKTNVTVEDGDDEDDGQDDDDTVQT